MRYSPWEILTSMAAITSHQPTVSRLRELCSLSTDCWMLVSISPFTVSSIRLVAVDTVLDCTLVAAQRADVRNSHTGTARRQHITSD